MAVTRRKRKYRRNMLERAFTKGRDEPHEFLIITPVQRTIKIAQQAIYVLSNDNY